MLRDAYARTIGVEYMHIQEPEQKEWIQAQRRDAADAARRPSSSAASSTGSTRPRRSRGSSHTKYLGPEALQPRRRREPHPDARRAAQRRGRRGHGRGRARHRAPRPAQRAREHGRQELRPDLPRVRGRARPGVGAGLGRREVPRRLGRARTPRRRAARSSVTLASNPSHLEAVDPVVEGMARAKGDRRGDTDRGRRCCRCSCTATPRSPARAWSPRR